MKNKFFLLLILVIILAGCNKQNTSINLTPDNQTKNISNSTNDTNTSIQENVEAKNNIPEEKPTEIKQEDDIKIQNINNKKSYQNLTTGFSLEFPEALIFRNNAFYTEVNWDGIVNKKTDHMYVPEFTVRFASDVSLDEFIYNSINPNYKNHFNSNKNKIKEQKTIGNNKFFMINSKNFDSNGCSYYIENNKNIMRLSTAYNCGENELIENVLISIKTTEN